MTPTYNILFIPDVPPIQPASQFERIQQQLKLMQEQQAELRFLKKVAALTKVVFDFLQIKNPAQLCSLDVKFGAREKQSLSLVSFFIYQTMHFNNIWLLETSQFLRYSTGSPNMRNQKQSTLFCVVLSHS